MDKELLASVSRSTEENILVVVRCRPLSKQEETKKFNVVIDVNSQESCVNVNRGDTEPPIVFRYDAVFPPATSQADVYNIVARPIVENVLEGYNGTIFAYGQTGTGKTFTMEGDNNIPELKGIIPNSFAQIFSHISNAQGDKRFLVRCSYLEIYNEEIHDLLINDRTKKLELKESNETGVYVKDLSSFVVRNADDMDRIMSLGNQSRTVASTNMNSVSSRSHAIFTITVECSQDISTTALKANPALEKEGDSTDEDDPIQKEEKKSKKVHCARLIRMGKLHLVDLAGSERLSKTGASGMRLREATRINLSLSCLGNVISALIEGNSHIPYRNSKLTRLLQDSLGGNAKTVMCANIGPADYNVDETISTLRYANRAKNIRNNAKINEDPKDALLRQFEIEIEELRRQLEKESAKKEKHSSSAQSNKSTNSEDDGVSGGAEGQDDEEYVNLIPIANEETLNGIKGEIANQAMLTSSIDNQTSESRKALNVLQERYKTWKTQNEKRNQLKERLDSIQKRILVGGENLLDKSQSQEMLLLRSMKELTIKQEEERQLSSTLRQAEAERKVLEEQILRHHNLDILLNKKLKKKFYQYQREKMDLQQVEQEYNIENSTILENISRTSRELEFQNVIIDNFIPKKYQSLIENACTWNEDNGDWSLNCIAYAGNNMHKSLQDDQEQTERRQTVDISHMYLSINDYSPINPKKKSTTVFRPRTSSKRAASSYTPRNPPRI